MKILCIDSASDVAACAVIENGMIIGEYTILDKKTHSEKLMPLIDRLLSDIGIEVKNIDAFAISEGPGSYTGLRIGASIVKSMAFATDKKIISVPTIMSLAANVVDFDNFIIPIMDGNAGRVYSGIYKWSNSGLKTIKEQFPCDIDELVDIMNGYKNIILCGDGAKNYKDILDKSLKNNFKIVPEQYNYLKISSLAYLAFEKSKNDEFENAEEFFPKYLRLSQAERIKKNI